MISRREFCKWIVVGAGMAVAGIAPMFSNRKIKILSDGNVIGSAQSVAFTERFNSVVGLVHGVTFEAGIEKIFANRNFHPCVQSFPLDIDFQDGEIVSSWMDDCRPIVIVSNKDCVILNGFLFTAEKIMGL